jgi:hypothetical protein
MLGLQPAVHDIAYGRARTTGYVTISRMISSMFVGTLLDDFIETIRTRACDIPHFAWCTIPLRSGHIVGGAMPNTRTAD